MANALLDFLNVLPKIGIQPSDTDSRQLRKRFMNSMALLMSCGGLLWGGISLFYGAYLQASIPLGYSLLTAGNLIFFHFSKNFGVYRFLQVLMSLMLPFLFQWTLGGLIESGGMMLWSFLALVGSMSVQDVRVSVYWLIAFVGLVIFSGFIDEYMFRFSLGLSKEVHTWFFIVNVAFISSVIFSLTLYYINSRNVANEDLKELTATLENKVEDRTRDLKHTNARLTSVNDELLATLDQVQEKNELIQLKNKNITDSLNYAQRIQKAILSNSDEACNKLEESFIFFKPKDIVSGDFYWFHCDKENGKFIAAVVDCTGHGVPGAFMSLIGDSLLNQIIIDKRILDPGTILTEMDKGIQKALKSEESHRRDGMDMAIVVLSENQRTIKYAGAKIPLVYACCESVHVLKGSVHPIGGGKIKKEKKFVTQTAEIPANSMIYLFSDGYPDQLGGKDATKYLTKHFRNYLQTIATANAKDQYTQLENEFRRWKGDMPQTDDVLVVGIRV